MALCKYKALHSFTIREIKEHIIKSQGFSSENNEGATIQVRCGPLGSWL